MFVHPPEATGPKEAVRAGRTHTHTSATFVRLRAPEACIAKDAARRIRGHMRRSGGGRGPSGGPPSRMGESLAFAGSRVSLALAWRDALRTSSNQPSNSHSQPSGIPPRGWMPLHRIGVATSLPLLQAVLGPRVSIADLAETPPLTLVRFKFAWLCGERKNGILSAFSQKKGILGYFYKIKSARSALLHAHAVCPTGPCPVLCLKGTLPLRHAA